MQTEILTIKEFEAIEGDYELDEGRLVPVERAGFYHGVVCYSFARMLSHYIDETGSGVVSTNDPSCVLQVKPATVLAPDLVFVRGDRLPPDSEAGFLKVPPDLVLEVVSPTSTKPAMRRKVRQYLTAGVRLVWVANPKTRTVLVYWANGKSQTLQATDTLDGGDVLPGFRGLVGTCFPDRPRS